MAASWLAGLLVALWSAGCVATDVSPPKASPFDPSSGIPPTPKQALQLLIRNHDVPLDVDASCAGVGTDFSDQSIGDYLSGFLAELSGPQSSITAMCGPRREGGTAGPWPCDVLLGHAEGDEEWRWGVHFDVDAASGSLIRSSVRCTGMG
jgi:hypothetical protein